MGQKIERRSKSKFTMTARSCKAGDMVPMRCLAVHILFRLALAAKGAWSGPSHREKFHVRREIFVSLQFPLLNECYAKCSAVRYWCVHLAVQGRA